MAITTMDGVVGALGTSQRMLVNKASVTTAANRVTSFWMAAGMPAPGLTTTGQATSGAVLTSADTGALLFTNSGNTYLGGLRGTVGLIGNVILYDILWVWTSGGSGWSVTTTGAQSTVSPTALTRPDANGVGTELWMETLATGGTASGTSTITYTNSAGTGSRTATLRDGAPVSASPVGTIQLYTLATGDTGVKSVQSINNSATWSSGTFRLMIVRRIAEVANATITGFAYDALDLGMPRIYDSACLGLACLPNNTPTGPLIMSVQLLQG